MRRSGIDDIKERLHSPILGYESIVLFSKLKWQILDLRGRISKLIRTRSSDAHKGYLRVKSDKCEPPHITLDLIMARSDSVRHELPPLEESLCKG